MYQVCTCHNSQYTNGDPHCPIHGKQFSATMIVTPCSYCAAKEAEFKKAQDYIHELLTTGHRQNAEIEELKATCQKQATEYFKQSNEIERLSGKTGYCTECERLTKEYERLEKQASIAYSDLNKELATALKENEELKKALELACDSGTHQEDESGYIVTLIDLGKTPDYFRK